MSRGKVYLLALLGNLAPSREAHYDSNNTEAPRPVEKYRVDEEFPEQGQ